MKIKHKKQGSLITEVLITMLLVVITIVSVVPMIYSGVKTSKLTKTRSVCSNIVQKEIEKFNQMRFSATMAKVKALIKSDTLVSSTFFENRFKDLDLTGDLASYTSRNSCIYLNEATGDFKDINVCTPTNSVNCICNTLEEPNLVNKNYQKYNMRTVYSFYPGNTSEISDDTLVVSVNIQKDASNDNSKVDMVTTLSRDVMEQD